MFIYPSNTLKANEEKKTTKSLFSSSYISSLMNKKISCR